MFARADAVRFGRYMPFVGPVDRTLSTHVRNFVHRPPPVGGHSCVYRDDSGSSEESGPMDREVELREFVSARGTALSRAAYLLTGDHQAAEDLVQETYVVLVRRWQRSGAVDPEAYVRRILYSRFVDGWRRRRLSELPWASPPDGPTHDEAGAVTDRLTLEGALARLTPKQRAVLVLRFYEDLTEAQAAAALGTSPNTVKSQTRVALERLRELAPDVVTSFEGAET
jgi:RNA polymerase sigma-70 factor (sigma-E family)